MGSGKNRFLPFSSGKNWFSPLLESTLPQDALKMVMVMVMVTVMVMVMVMVMVIVMVVIMVRDWQELVLAILKIILNMFQWWQEPSDNIFCFLSGKYQFLPFLSCKKWQEPWQEPCLNYMWDIEGRMICAVNGCNRKMQRLRSALQHIRHDHYGVPKMTKISDNVSPRNHQGVESVRNA